MSEPGEGEADRPPGHGGPRCPICGKPRSEEYRPFCSKRCADVDLGRWLSGRYAIAGEADADEDGETGEAPPSEEEGR
jgi:hypothetical protein